MSVLYLRCNSTQNYIYRIKKNHSIPILYKLQYRHLVPAPVNRTSASAWLHRKQWIICAIHKRSTSMIHVACKSNVQSVVTPRKLGGNRAFSARINCQHCMCHSKSGYTSMFCNIGVWCNSISLCNIFLHLISKNINNINFKRRTHLTT